MPTCSRFAMGSDEHRKSCFSCFPGFLIHLVETIEQPTLRSSRIRRWLVHLWREWTTENWRPVSPAFAKPDPAKWNDTQITIAWIGHATVLINFFGIRILTDPVLFSRIGIRLPGFTVGPKRLTAPALETLAIIAYHQPVTRAEIEAIRGVMVSKGTLDSLLEAGWVRIRGRKRTPGLTKFLYGKRTESTEA